MKGLPSLHLVLPVLLVEIVYTELIIFPKVKTITMTEGESVRLTCKNKDGTSLDMKWRGPDGKVAERKTASSIILKLPNIVVEQAGYYTCEATIDGELKQIKILIKMKKVVKFLSDTNQFIKNGADSNIYCKNTASSNQYKYINWYIKGKDGKLKSLGPFRFVPSYNEEEGDFLCIRNVVPADANTYECQVMFTDTGDSYPFDIKAVISSPPKDIKIRLDPPPPKVPIVEGNRLFIFCQARGDPDPTYTFYKGSTQLSKKRCAHGTCVLNKVQRTDEGEYTCNAKNNAGECNQTFSLDVKIPPSIENTENGSTIEGDSVQLTCKATGEPVPSMSWRKRDSQVDFITKESSDIYVEEVDEKPIKDTPEGSVLYRRTLYLVINKTKSEQFGEYACKAKNDYGMAERFFKIEVQFKPNFRNQGAKVFYGWSGGKINMTCKANAFPEPLFIWIKGSETIYYKLPPNISYPDRATYISNLEREVPNLNKESVLGNYFCTVMNKLGKKKQTLTLQEAVPPEQAVVTFVNSSATEITLDISPPTIDGGQPVTKFVIKYGAINDSGSQELKEVDRPLKESSILVTLEDLIPNTNYSIEVTAVNVVGGGPEVEIIEATTKRIPKPKPKPNGRAGKILGTGRSNLVVALVIPTLLVLILTVDAVLCRTKQWGLMWKINKALRRKDGKTFGSQHTATGAQGPDKGFVLTSASTFGAESVVSETSTNGGDSTEGNGPPKQEGLTDEESSSTIYSSLQVSTVEESPGNVLGQTSVSTLEAESEVMGESTEWEESTTQENPTGVETSSISSSSIAVKPSQ